MARAPRAGSSRRLRRRPWNPASACTALAGLRPRSPPASRLNVLFGQPSGQRRGSPYCSARASTWRSSLAPTCAQLPTARRRCRRRGSAACAVRFRGRRRLVPRPGMHRASRGRSRGWARRGSIEALQYELTVSELYSARVSDEPKPGRDKLGDADRSRRDDPRRRRGTVRGARLRRRQPRPDRSRSGASRGGRRAIFSVPRTQLYSARSWRGRSKIGRRRRGRPVGRWPLGRARTRGPSIEKPLRDAVEGYLDFLLSRPAFSS